jgi:type VI secretion system VasD/TssJ family lipoprotein
MPLAALPSRLLVCLVLAGACAHRDGPLQAPPWRIEVAAELSRTPPPGMDTAVPTELRVYQLHSLGVFDSLSYEQLFDDDRGALGESLVARLEDRVFLYPQRPWHTDLDIDRKTRFVVVVAFLHRPVGRSWSYVAALPPALAAGETVTRDQLAARPTGLTVRVGPDRVSGRPRFSLPPPAPRRARRAPKLPQIPSLPSTPPVSTPTTPSLPNSPSAPSAPSLPGKPSAPSRPFR